MENVLRVGGEVDIGARDLVGRRNVCEIEVMTAAAVIVEVIPLGEGGVCAQRHLPV